MHREEIEGYRYKGGVYNGHAEFNDDGTISRVYLWEYWLGGKVITSWCASDVKYPLRRDSDYAWYCAFVDDYLLTRLLTACGYYDNR